ncbi:RraA family protein [Shouchella shacheensis]|uniref:RraA family protein n=1 Tax=Shouchella shacheensis TaxID=1649580 RepID=UPI00074031CA|nr:RraA family protein [Shouchella shacheensis]
MQSWKLFEGIPTTCVSDALKGSNHMDQAVRPLKPDWHLAGKAYTVSIPAGENKAVLQAIYHAEPGEVLVIDGKFATDHAIAGDFIVGLAQTLGLNGIVSDGVIRDINDTVALDFPVFCQGTTPAAGKKTKEGERQVPINCGGVQVRPGDIIVGDIDGVVVVPAEQAKEVQKAALEKVKSDEERLERISGNPEAVREYLRKFL